MIEASSLNSCIIIPLNLLTSQLVLLASLGNHVIFLQICLTILLLKIPIVVRSILLCQRSYFEAPFLYSVRKKNLGLTQSFFPSSILSPPIPPQLRSLLPISTSSPLLSSSSALSTLSPSLRHHAFIYAVSTVFCTCNSFFQCKCAT